MKDCGKNFMEDKRTLLFIYFAGHGITLDGGSAILINGRSVYFSLEKMARALASYPETYVMVQFDCCRAEVNPDKWHREERKLETEGDARGEEGLTLEKLKKTSNLIVTYGCEPKKGVQTKSTLVNAFFQFLEIQKDETGYITLPGDLIYFRGTDGKSETLPRVSQPIKIKWND